MNRSSDDDKGQFKKKLSKLLKDYRPSDDEIQEVLSKTYPYSVANLTNGIEKRDELIKTLKGESEMEYNEIMNLIQRYSKWKSVLPSYSKNLQTNLDGINKRMNSVIPFRYVGRSPHKKLIGFVFIYEKIGL